MLDSAWLGFDGTVDSDFKERVKESESDFDSEVLFDCKLRGLSSSYN